MKIVRTSMTKPSAKQARKPKARVSGKYCNQCNALNLEIIQKVGEINRLAGARAAARATALPSPP